MSDFFNTFGDPTRRRREEEDRYDFWSSTFGDPAESSRVGASFFREPEYERGWFERVFAPFQAPQEGLFRLTQNIADEGLTASGVIDAFGHAARFFNPWSNIPMQDPDEIRQIFFGEQADASGFTRFGANLAISVLYDPLLFAGLAKGVGLVQQGSRGHNALRHLTNPAGAILEGTRHATRDIIGPTIHRMGRQALGDARWELHATRAAQWLTNQSAGVDPELVRLARLHGNTVTEWRQEHYNVLKQAEGLRGRESQRLLADALQSEAVYLHRSGQQLSKRQAQEFAALEQRLRASGVSEDLFYQVYDRARRLDDTIGQGLYEMGVIGRRDMEVYRGTHLKRMYSAFERPMEYIDRIEAMASANPALAGDVTRLSYRTLRDNLQKLGDDLLTSPEIFRPSPGDMSEIARSAARRDAQAAWASTLADSPYFTQGGRRGGFNAERFADDLVDFLDHNSNATLEQVFDHVRNNMLRGTEMAPDFWKTIGNHISGAQYTSPGLTTYASKLRELAHGGPGITFRTLREHTELVAKRENLRPEIREALGEILEAAPRIAAQGLDNTQLLETRRLFDHVAGTRRVSEEAGDLLQRARKHLSRNEDVPETLMQDIAQHLGRNVSPEDLAKLDTGAVLQRQSTRWASLERTAQHNLQLPDSPGLGEMAGRWVSSGTYLMFNRMAASAAQSAEPARTMAGKLSDYVRKGVGQFKIMKVIMDPTAQFRNFIGNAILMDMQGTSPLRVDRLIKSGTEVMAYMRTGKKGKYMGLLESAGVPLFDTTFTGTEMREVARHLIRDPLTKRNFKEGFTSIFDGIRRASSNTLEAGMQTFEFNERLFKLNVFADHYEKLASGVVRAGRRLTPETQNDIVRQAAALAEQALFNYADVPYLVDFARKYGIVPFATFPFKAIPYAAKTLMENPHRVLKYDRIVDRANEQLAGGPQEVAREIQGLPQHLRDGMVVRLPFNDNQDRPLYIDMAYYLPWSPLQQMIEQVKGGTSGVFGTPETGVGDYGIRGGILTPPWFAVYDAIRHNVDSLGRPIVRPAMSQEEKFQAVFKFMTEFWMPPSGPGGSRQESVGRALQASARNTPETQDWVDVLGRTMRLGANQDRIIAGHGMSPQSQAIVDSPAGPVAGSLWALLAGGAHASDPEQSRLNAAAEFRGNFTDLAREIASVRNNRSLSFEQKREKILRLRAEQQRMQEEYVRYTRGL